MIISRQINYFRRLDTTNGNDRGWRGHSDYSMVFLSCLFILSLFNGLSTFVYCQFIRILDLSWSPVHSPLPEVICEKCPKIVKKKHRFLGSTGGHAAIIRWVYGKSKIISRLNWPRHAILKLFSKKNDILQKVPVSVPYSANISVSVSSRLLGRTYINPWLGSQRNLTLRLFYFVRQWSENYWYLKLFTILSLRVNSSE